MSGCSEVVFVPAPGIGHLVSTIEFAKILLHRHDRLSVTVLCLGLQFSPDARDYTTSLVGSHHRITLLHLPPVDPPPVDPRKSPELFVYAAIESEIPHVREALRNLVGSARAVAGLVLDFFCMPLLDVASELGLPSYMFLPSNLGFLSLMLHLPSRHDRVGSEFDESKSESVVTLPGLAKPVPVNALPSAVFNKEGGYASYVKLARRFRDVKGIIVNSFAELEDYSLNWLRRDDQEEGETTPAIYAVGPVLDLEGRAHPGLDRARRDEIAAWLDAQPPSSVVLLCFGSFGSFPGEQLREIAAGLERSGWRFLWAGRASEPGKSMEEFLPEGFRGRVGGWGMVVEGWAPQAEALGHKAVGGFVSHCGWNSVLESVWHGVPVATWPMYAEQQMNAFRVARELGLAVEMRLDYRIGGGDVVPADEICEAVLRVMDGESRVRERVKEMSVMARKAVARGGSSFAAVEKLIDDILGSHSN